jgi:hypothetical protein
MEKPKIIFNISSALFSLVPNAIWAVRDGVLEWNDSEVTRPSDAEIDAEVKRLQAEYDAQAYARNRAAEYPSIEELTIALYDEDDKAAIIAKRAAVKKKYPKPSE